MVAEFRYVGNPFLDAGLAALLAAADKTSPKELTAKDIERAIERLKTIMIGPEKDKRLSVSRIFPNSPLASASVKNKEEAYSNFLEEVLEKFLNHKEGSKICPFCSRRFERGEEKVKAHKFPLLRGPFNFYPGMRDGLEICPVCSLQIQFFPLSVMKASRLLWFIHTSDFGFASSVSKFFCWRHHETSYLTGQRLNYYGDWNSFSQHGIALSLFYKLLTELPEYQPDFLNNKHPVVVYTFDNDNRGVEINYFHVPRKLLRFLGSLYYSNEKEFKRFFKELIFIAPDENNKAVFKRIANVSKRLFEGQSIISYSLVDKTEKLLGSWEAHTFYAMEVLDMSPAIVGIIERLGKHFYEADYKKNVQRLKKGAPGEIQSMLLKAVKDGKISSAEYYALVKESGAQFYELRDYLLAVMYELNQTGGELRERNEAETVTPDVAYRRFREIAEKVFSSHPNPNRVVGDLKTSKKPQGIRKIYLACVERGVLNFNDFAFLSPMDDLNALYERRDFLLACLYEYSQEETDESEKKTEESASDDIEETKKLQKKGNVSSEGKVSASLELDFATSEEKKQLPHEERNKTNDRQTEGLPGDLQVKQLKHRRKTSRKNKAVFGQLKLFEM